MVDIIARENSSDVMGGITPKDSLRAGKDNTILPARSSEAMVVTIRRERLSVPMVDITLPDHSWALTVGITLADRSWA